MRITRKFLQLTKKTYPHGTESGLRNQLPNGYQEDGLGNFYLQIGEMPSTMFTCHLDTADRSQMKVNHVFDGKFIKTDGKTILGADDKAGMTIILYMISKQVPGLYYFFIGEERGCIGSKRLSDNWSNTEFSKYITKVVSFDRRGTDSVITEQFYGVCCSDEFAKDLSKKLNDTGMGFKYQPDPTGIYTDSAQFVNIVPECTNISVGYYNEHTCNERQDIEHLKKLCRAVCQIDWESIPIVRKAGQNYQNDYWGNPGEDEPGDGEWSSENYSYFSFSDKKSTKMYISKTQIDNEKAMILSFLNQSGICSGHRGIRWNGNYLHIEYANGTLDYLGNRFDLIEFIPELSEVSTTHVKKNISNSSNYDDDFVSDSTYW